MKKTLPAVLLFTGLSTLSGCAQHYTHIRDIPFVDANFKRCVVLQGKTYSDQITELKCQGQYISLIKELSNFRQLRHLDLSHNLLTRLDVSDNPSLEVLSVEHNRLKSLKVKDNRKLKVLNASYNHLKTLDVRKNTTLMYLNYHVNPMKKVDIRHNPHLVAPYSKTYIPHGPTS